MFRQMQREQEERDKKREGEKKPFGLIARMQADGWQPGDPLPPVDAIEADHTIEGFTIPIAKPIEWLMKPLAALVRASWLGKMVLSKSGLKFESSVKSVTGKSYQALGEVTSSIKNTELLEKLNATSKGDWIKVYEAGLQDGLKVETHYFRNNTTGQVFDVKKKYDYWHQKSFKKIDQ